MPVSLELPGQLLRRCNAAATASSRSLDQFMADALEDKLNAVDRAGGKPWMKHVGNHRETQRINSIIDREFEEIDPEMWR